MSSLVSRCNAWLEFPTEQSNTVCFFCCSSMIFSSMVPVATKRVACTGLVCPMRWARWMACSSEAGFHQGSMRKMWSAACRLRPSPPAFKEMSKTFKAGSVWKEMMMLLLEATGMLPRSFAQLMPSRFILHSMSSRKVVNCEKTKALLPGSDEVMRKISCIKASIFVELLNSAVFILCIMLVSLRPGAPACTSGLGVTSSSSSRLTVSGAKHVGHPMPPLASRGAWLR
mmetsp:Transcript_12327/g.34942  ORF Transcript_12327/g.34942 Transcript_12327/m.34942 type:complete len:228 (+) Transcript_12327:116-799(+)